MTNESRARAMSREDRLPFSALALLNQELILESDEEETSEEAMGQLQEASDLMEEAEAWERQGWPPSLFALPNELLSRIVEPLPARAIGRLCCTCRAAACSLERGLCARADALGLHGSNGTWRSGGVVVIAPTQSANDSRGGLEWSIA